MEDDLREELVSPVGHAGGEQGHQVVGEVTEQPQATLVH